MINFSLGEFIAARMRVSHAIDWAGRAPKDATLTPEGVQLLTPVLEAVGLLAGTQKLEATQDRLARSWQHLKPETFPWYIAEQLRALFDAMEDDAKKEHFFHYPRERALLVIGVPEQWAPTISKFASLEPEISAAMDCYALGHNLACVFHLMRVMEVGVQRFGKRLGVKLTKKKKTRLEDLTWHQILNDLNPKLDAMPQLTQKSKEKCQRYKAAQSHLYAVKDAWRNPTMHPRKSGYNDLETQNIINHVRSFMNGLASKTDLAIAGTRLMPGNTTWRVRVCQV